MKRKKKDLDRAMDIRKKECNKFLQNSYSQLQETKKIHQGVVKSVPNAIFSRHLKDQLLHTQE